jgi:potassium channel subfamily K, other eukaryote
MESNTSPALDASAQIADPKAQPLLTTREDVERQQLPLDGDDDQHPPPRDGEKPRGRGLERAKSRSWRKLSDYVTTGEVLLTGPTLLNRSDIPVTSGTGDSVGGSDERFVRRQKEKETTIRLKRWHFQRMMSFSLTQVMVALLCHVAVAIVAFSFLFHNWTVVDSVYFAVVTFTTIGYGDLIPLSHAARFFTCVYALSGVTCLGIAIGVVSANIAEARDKAVREAKESDKVRALALFRTDSMARLSAEPSRTQSFGSFGGGCGSAGCHVDTAANDLCTRFVKWLSDIPRPTGAAKIFAGFLVVLLVLGVFGAFISRDPAIGAAEIAYFLVITATTLGFGDVAPTSQAGRLATAIFIPLAVGTMGHWLAIVAKYIVDQRQQAFRSTFQAEGISLADLQAMDTDDDGNVSRAEFLEFMLLAMNKVDKALLEELRAHFDRLDSDRSGALSKDDLIALARRQLKKPSRKLELARYKRRLREQADQARRREVSWFSPERFSLSNIFHSPSVESHEPSRGTFVAGAASNCNTNNNNVFRNDTLDSLDLARTSSVLDSHGICLTASTTSQPAAPVGVRAPVFEGRELV